MNLSNQMPLQAIEVAQSSWLPLRQEFMEDWKKLVIQKICQCNCDQME